jgi:leader peptidase (prepilin peptidase)/N-methyltransferase
MQDIQPEEDRVFPGNGTLLWLAILTLAAFAGLLSLVPPLPAAFTAYLFLTMALITLIDLRHFIIPDVLSLPAIAVGLLANIVLFPEGNRFAGLTHGLAGAVAGGGAFYLLRAVYFRLRGIEGLGLGDVKLAAVAGAWLGPAALPSACLLATLSASRQFQPRIRPPQQQQQKRRPRRVRLEVPAREFRPLPRPERPE